MSVLEILFGLLSLLFLLMFLIDCIRFRKQIKAYVKYGILCGLILVAIDISTIPFIPDLFSITPIYKLIVTDFLALFQITLFACVGMYSCSLLKTYDFPAIRLIHNLEERKRIFSGIFVSVIITTVLSVTYSVILFKLTSPDISEFIKLLTPTIFDSPILTIIDSRRPAISIV